MDQYNSTAVHSSSIPPTKRLPRISYLEESHPESPNNTQHLIRKQTIPQSQIYIAHTLYHPSDRSVHFPEHNSSKCGRFLNLPEARSAILRRRIRFPEDGDGKAFDRIVGGRVTYQPCVDDWEEYGNRGSIEAVHLDAEESSDQAAGRSGQQKDLQQTNTENPLKDQNTTMTHA